MRKRITIVSAAIAASALAGAATAAEQASKTMRVPLADGSAVTIEYVGDVPPKVTVVPSARAPRLSHWIFPGFADFDRMIADMNRRSSEMMQQMERMRRQRSADGIPPANLASASSMPAGTTSISVVTVSKGGRSCTRTTEMVSQGSGKQPKVTSNVSGDCGPGTKGGAEPAALNQT